MALKATLIDSFTLRKAISVKGKNEESIALAYKPVYHTWTKHIDIKYYYIHNKVAVRQINHQYIPSTKIIIDGLTKAFIHAEF